MSKQIHNPPNRLIHEKSPYLLQHAYNPVDWYAWSPEALLRAKQEERPILLSIGYSTCHWCHVMERESFSDPEIARLMNAHFVCIKLDREERPDLDHLFITAVSAIRGSAGWPLNVFLTPELKPFYGGTYFPPRRRPGMASWSDVLTLLAKTWEDPGQREKILNSAGEMDALIRKHLGGDEAAEPMETGFLDSAFKAFEQRYDPSWGGFSQAPKFPSPAIQTFLFFYHASAGKNGNPGAKEKALEMALVTLRNLAGGGIYDQIGGGFHRYSTDSRWRVPHFEKMLYDNAQLILNYLDAFQLTRDPFFEKIARETLDYVAREMTHPEGGFYSAQDADSLPHSAGGGEGFAESAEKREGAFYTWTLPEIVEALGEQDAALFSHRFGVLPGGNVPQDPNGEFFGKNILYRAHTPEQTARKFQVSVASVREILDTARHRLLSLRSRRPKPHLDDKIITAWNGLMISAWAKAYQVLGNPEDRLRAVSGSEFVWTHLFDESQRVLFRIWREGSRRIPGMAEDYASLIQGLLDTYEASFDIRWLHRACELARILMEGFYDLNRGGFYLNPESPLERSLPRVKETHDGVTPSASSLAALALFRLHRFTGDPEFFRAAEATFKSFAPILRRQPEAVPLMMTVSAHADGKDCQIVVVGSREDPQARRMLDVGRAVFHPAKTLLLVDSPSTRDALAGGLPFLAGVRPDTDTATTLVCRGQTCTTPITDPEKLREALGEKPKN